MTVVEDQRNPGCRTCEFLEIGENIYTCEPLTEKGWDPIEGFSYKVFNPILKNKEGTCRDYKN